MLKARHCFMHNFKLGQLMEQPKTSSPPSAVVGFKLKKNIRTLKSWNGMITSTIKLT
jgi:hypothetical protein